MRFLDSSTFLYAILKPARQSPPHVTLNKQKAKAIITRIQEGEQVTTTVVHVSEIANILESKTTLREARAIIQAILDTRSITITPVDPKQIQSAIQQADKHDIGINDALAYEIMRGNTIHEIYSNDKHFDSLPGITRIWQ